MTKDDLLPLKLKYLEYFKQLPVQKLAAASIGRDEDTILRWRKEDADFADKVEQGKAEWALSNIKRVKSREWLLERLMKDHFGGKEDPGSLTQNNFFNLTDEQLDKIIQSKARQIGADPIIAGEGETDSGEPAEVLEITQEAEGVL